MGSTFARLRGQGAIRTNGPMNNHTTNLLIQAATLLARIDELDSEIDEASNTHRDLVQLQNALQRELDKLSEQLNNTEL